MLTLTIGAVVGKGATPPVKKGRLDLSTNHGSGFILELNYRCLDHSAYSPVMDNQQPMFVQPLSGADEQLVTVSTSGYLVTKCADKGAPLTFTYPSEAKGFASYLLMIENNVRPRPYIVRSDAT